MLRQKINLEFIKSKKSLDYTIEKQLWTHPPISNIRTSWTWFVETIVRYSYIITINAFKYYINLDTVEKKRKQVEEEDA